MKRLSSNLGSQFITVIFYSDTLAGLNRADINPIGSVINYGII